jgi:2-methylcitrate dehydratase PrpD
MAQNEFGRLPQMPINRREWMGWALTGACLGTSKINASASDEPSPHAGSGSGTKYGAAALGLGVTSEFARFLASIRYEDLPPEAVHEAKRAVLDWMGCAVAGSQHPTVQILLATFTEIGSAPTATVIGHDGRKLSLLDAPVANGQMGHILDFDDTHLGGVILHTSTATLPALFALGEKRKSSGRDLIVALAAAFESGIRVGQAAPRHHFGGWHLTGTLGTVAATGGAARLIGLNSQQTTFALGIGCTQAAGMQQNRGSDCKSFHAGKSAYHGVLSAMLASNGFNSSPEILEGSLGFTKVFSSTQNNAAITDGLGKKWMIVGNGYKPYACGVVLHPLIDATIKVSRSARIPASEVTQLEVLVHPDVIRITGIDTPGSGLMSKFSANHAAAVAYIDQAAGVAQFSNERSGDPVVQAFRKIVFIKPMLNFRLDQAAARVQGKSGTTREEHIEHATGTVSNPMSDEALKEKFFGNTTKTIGKEKARRVVEMVWKLDLLGDIGELVRTCT